MLEGGANTDSDDQPGKTAQQTVGLSVNWLQIRSFGPYIISFLPHGYGYGPANELKSVLEASNFRFSPHSPTASQATRQVDNAAEPDD